MAGDRGIDLHNLPRPCATPRPPPGAPPAQVPGRRTIDLLKAKAGYPRALHRPCSLDRPRTHCGAADRAPLTARDSPFAARVVPLAGARETAAEGGVQSLVQDEEETVPLGASTGRGTAALEGIANGCRSCFKLRLRLENEERARVKAQEHLAKVRADVGLSHKCCDACSSAAASPVVPTVEVSCEEPALGHAATPSEARRPATTASADGRRPTSAPGSAAGAAERAAKESSVGSVALAGQEEASRLLERYRREVELVRRQLKERDERETVSAQLLRKQRSEHEASKQDWETQLAGLLCDVQDLETRNRQLESQLQARSQELDIVRNASAEPAPRASSYGGMARVPSPPLALS